MRVVKQWTLIEFHVIGIDDKYSFRSKLGHNLHVIHGFLLTRLDY